MDCWLEDQCLFRRADPGNSANVMTGYWLDNWGLIVTGWMTEVWLGTIQDSGAHTLSLPLLFNYPRKHKVLEICIVTQRFIQLLERIHSHITSRTFVHLPSPISWHRTSLPKLYWVELIGIAHEWSKQSFRPVLQSVKRIHLSFLYIRIISVLLWGTCWKLLLMKTWQDEHVT